MRLLSILLIPKSYLGNLPGFFLNKEMGLIIVFFRLFFTENFVKHGLNIWGVSPQPVKIGFLQKQPEEISFLIRNSALPSS